MTTDDKNLLRSLKKEHDELWAIGNANDGQLTNEQGDRLVFVMDEIERLLWAEIPVLIGEDR